MKRIYFVFVVVSMVVIFSSTASSQLNLTGDDCDRACDTCQKHCSSDDNAKYNDCLKACVDNETVCCKMAGGGTTPSVNCNCYGAHN